MIIFTNTFAAAEEDAARPLTNARIGYQTWLRDLAASAITVSSEDEDGPKDAPLREETWEFWRPTALPATWMIDMGVARDLDYVGLVHTLGSAGCSVEVETSDGTVGSPTADGFIWTTFAQAALPSDDCPMLFLDTSRTCRYLRLTIEDGGDSEEMPTIAVVYAGEVLAMQRAIYGGHSPITLSRETELTRTLSKGGQFLGQSFRRHGVVGNASFRHLTAAWYRENFDPFVKAARQYPFFFGWRPETFPNEVAYAWCADSIRPSNMGVLTYMQVAFNMNGIGHE